MHFFPNNNNTFKTIFYVLFDWWDRRLKRYIFQLIGRDNTGHSIMQTARAAQRGGGGTGSIWPRHPGRGGGTWDPPLSPPEKFMLNSIYPGSQNLGHRSKIGPRHHKGSVRAALPSKWVLVMLCALLIQNRRRLQWNSEVLFLYSDAIPAGFANSCRWIYVTDWLTPDVGCIRYHDA